MADPSTPNKSASKLASIWEDMISGTASQKGVHKPASFDMPNERRLVSASSASKALSSSSSKAVASSNSNSASPMSSSATKPPLADKSVSLGGATMRDKVQVFEKMASDPDSKKVQRIVSGVATPLGVGLRPLTSGTDMTRRASSTSITRSPRHPPVAKESRELSLSREDDLNGNGNGNGNVQELQRQVLSLNERVSKLERLLDAMHVKPSSSS